MDIYTLLCSKSTNFHYIRKYINFIENCWARPKFPDEYVEAHHICPKASDLFPEYKDFNTHPWNKIYLNAREHVVAHVMLWKIFGGSQTHALNYMLNFQNKDTQYEYVTGKNRIIPSSILIRYAANLREEANAMRLGMALYKNQEQDVFYLYSSDPIIQELNLVGFQTGNKHTKETIQKMHLTKLKNKVVTMWFLNYKRRIKLFSPKYDEHIAQGWTVGLTKEDKKYVKKLMYEKSSQTSSNTCNYMTEDGKFFARLSMDDPIIEELNLRTHITENHRKSWSILAEKSKEFNTGSKLYNNGVIEKKFKEPPDDPQWIPGRLPRSEEYYTNQRNGIKKKCLDSTTWNNGEIAIRVPKDKTPEELYPESTWVRGMLPRSEECKERVKKQTQNRCCGNTVWNNGKNNIRLSKEQNPNEMYPNDTWVRGFLPRKTKVI